MDYEKGSESDAEYELDDLRTGDACCCLDPKFDAPRAKIFEETDKWAGKRRETQSLIDCSSKKFEMLTKLLHIYRFLQFNEPNMHAVTLVHLPPFVEMWIS